MIGYQSKKAAAQAKLQCQCSMTTRLVGSGCEYCNPEYLYDDDAQPAQEPVREALKLAKNLLARCETEMRYAGWTNLETDNPQRQELYIDVQKLLEEKNT